MQRLLILATLALLAAPFSSAHKPPGPVTHCQFGWLDNQYHDYLPPATGLLMVGADGNLQNCNLDPLTVQVLNDHGTTCQTLKAIRGDPSWPPDVRQRAGDVHSFLCTSQWIGWDTPFADYDGELDHGYGGAILAVESGDSATWGSRVCYGSEGHHDATIYAEEWALSVGGLIGPAFWGTADHSRTPPAQSWKGPRPDCGDSVIEPCDPSPPPSSMEPFPVNVVVDTVNFLVYGLFGPGGHGTFCNVYDCAQRSNGAIYPGPSVLFMTCPPGADGTYIVFVAPDFNAPHFPVWGHVWTTLTNPNWGSGPIGAKVSDPKAFTYRW